MSVLEEIPGHNPNTFARNLYTEMYDGRMDVVVWMWSSLILVDAQLTQLECLLVWTMLDLLKVILT